MELIKVDFQNEVTTMDREKFKNHVRVVTRKELEDDISQTMELLKSLMEIVRSCDLDSKKDQMAFDETYKKLRRQTQQIPHSSLRHRHMMQLIDTF